MVIVTLCTGVPLSPMVTVPVSLAPVCARLTGTLPKNKSKIKKPFIPLLLCMNNSPYWGLQFLELGRWSKGLRNGNRHIVHWRAAVTDGHRSCKFGAGLREANGN